MALFKHFRGNRASLDAQPLHDGYAYFCIDDGTFHIDYIDADGALQRKQISAKDAETLCGISLEELKAQIASQDAVILGEAQAYTDNAIANIDIPDVDLTDYATKQYVDDAVENVSVEVDTTLAQPGKAADAKAVGDAIAELLEKLSKIPVPTAADAGKFLVVDENGNYVLKTIPGLDGVMI